MHVQRATTPSLRPDNPIVAWSDVFAVFDDGSYPVSAYATLERQLSDQNRKFPSGLGCLVVIPAGAKRIQEDVRAEIERVLNAIKVRCLCWAVLEKGFRGASIRATLTTLTLVGRRRTYPTHVSGSLPDAVAWILPRLDGGQSRLHQASDSLAVFIAHLQKFETR
jgi:hypothetical protein